jgi:hypothetical protein
MKNHRKQPLTLTKETLRMLGDATLVQVLGGGLNNTVEGGKGLSCGSKCDTSNE